VPPDRPPSRSTAHDRAGRRLLREALVGPAAGSPWPVRDCERFRSTRAALRRTFRSASPAPECPRVLRRVGDDEFATCRRKAARRRRGRATPLRREGAPALWFVALDERGDRTFFSPGGLDSADKHISRQDVVAGHRRGRWTALRLVLPHPSEGQRALRPPSRARPRQGARVSFRSERARPPVANLRSLRSLCSPSSPPCALVKLSEDECEACVGERNPERAATCYATSASASPASAGRAPRDRRCAASAGSRRGGLGCRWWYHRRGRRFVAGLLSRLARDPIRRTRRCRARSSLACAVGSRVCTPDGARWPMRANLLGLSTSRATPSATLRPRAWALARQRRSAADAGLQLERVQLHFQPRAAPQCSLRGGASRAWAGRRREHLAPYQPQAGRGHRAAALAQGRHAVRSLRPLARTRGPGLRWDDLPVRLSAAHGELRFRSDGRASAPRRAFRRAAAVPDALLACAAALPDRSLEPQGPEADARPALVRRGAVTGTVAHRRRKQVLVRPTPTWTGAPAHVAPGFADIELEPVQSGARAAVRWRGELTRATCSCSRRTSGSTPPSARARDPDGQDRAIRPCRRGRDALARSWESRGIDQMAFAGRLPEPTWTCGPPAIHPTTRTCGRAGEGREQVRPERTSACRPLDRAVLLAAAQRRASA